MARTTCPSCHESFRLREDEGEEEDYANLERERDELRNALTVANDTGAEVLADSLKAYSLGEAAGRLVNQLQGERDVALAHAEQAVEDVRILRDLLAVIHRDDGHYTDQHGYRKATEDAIAIHHDLIRQRDHFQEQYQNAGEVILGLLDQIDKAKSK